MKTYKILSIFFILFCLGFSVAAIMLPNIPTGLKVVLVVCLLAVAVAMGCNIRQINAKHRANKNGEQE